MECHNYNTACYEQIQRPAAVNKVDFIVSCCHAYLIQCHSDLGLLG